MIAGFIEIRESGPVLHAFEKNNGSCSFIESRDLQDSDAYLKGLIEKLDRVFFAIPLEDLHFRVLKFPFTDRKKIEDIIPMQLEGMVSGSIKDIVYDFTVLGKTDDQYSIAVVFAMKEAVKKHIDALRAFEIRPEVVTSPEGFSAFTAGSLDPLLEGKAVDTNDEDRLKLMAEMIGADLINLARGEFSFRKDVEKARSLSRVTIALFFAVCVLLSAHFLIDMGMSSRKAGKLNEDMIKFYTTLIPGAGKVTNPLYQLKAKIKQIEAKQAEINDVRPLQMLKTIARTWTAGQSAESIKINTDLLTVSGEAGNADEVKSIAQGLENELGVKPVIETKQASGGKTGYTLQFRKAGAQE